MNYENWISNYKDPLAFVQHIKAQHEYIYDSKGNLEYWRVAKAQLNQSFDMEDLLCIGN